jgi:hypothetical protein
MTSSPRVRRQSGQVLYADSTTLILQRGAETVDTIALARISAGWQSAGRRSRWATGFRGFMLGVATGSLVGVGLDALSDNRTGDGSGEAFESVLVPLVGAVLGGSLGTLIGIGAGGEQWKAIPRSTTPSFECNGRPMWR